MKKEPHFWQIGDRFKISNGKSEIIATANNVYVLKGITMLSCKVDEKSFDVEAKYAVPIENEPYTGPEFPYPDTTPLRELAIYLEGIVRGQGDLSPLGTNHLAELWKTIQYLNMNAKT
jgi:hypothetical protein